MLYTGNGKVSMSAAIAFPEFTYQYRLLDMRQFPYQTFLQSSQPHFLRLAIISGFGGESKHSVTRKILHRLRELSLREGELPRRVKQRSRLGSLRNVSTIVIQEALAMAITLDKTKDGLYQLGKEDQAEEIALNMLKRGLEAKLIGELTGLSLEQIAALAAKLRQAKE